MEFWEKIERKKFIDLHHVDEELNPLGFYTKIEDIPGIEKIPEKKWASACQRAKIQMVNGTGFVYKLKRVQQKISF